MMRKIPTGHQLCACVWSTVQGGLASVEVYVRRGTGPFLLMASVADADGQVWVDGLEEDTEYVVRADAVYASGQVLAGPSTNVLRTLLPCSFEGSTTGNRLEASLCACNSGFEQTDLDVQVRRGRGI